MPSDLNLVLLAAAQSLAIISAFWLLLWAASLWLRNSSIGDPLYPVSMAIVAAFFYATGDGDPSRKLLMLVLTFVWAARLMLYIGWRNWGKEDPRYAHLRRHAESLGRNYAIYSLVEVFIKLGIVTGFPISFPLFLGQIFAAPGAPGAVACAGIAVFCVGLWFETVADIQLARFKRDPANHNKVMQDGLWRYSRHPNYFGEVCVWTGLFLVAVESPWGWLAIVSPLTLLWLLLGPLGLGLVERRMKKKRPEEFAAYERRTSPFIPWFPRKI
jgi:steroid 5-alpha reductase family enzyme